MKRLLSFFLTSIVCLFLFSCKSPTPNCTVKEKLDGYEMVDDNCGSVNKVTYIPMDTTEYDTILPGNDTAVYLTIDEAKEIVRKNPPSKKGEVNNDHLSDVLMYYFIFRATSPAAHPEFYDRYNDRHTHYKNNRSHYKKHRRKMRKTRSTKTRTRTRSRRTRTRTRTRRY